MHTALALATLKLLMHSILMECLTTTAPNKYLINTKNLHNLIRRQFTFNNWLVVSEVRSTVGNRKQRKVQAPSGETCFIQSKRYRCFTVGVYYMLPDTSKTFRVKLVVGREEKNIST